MKVCIENIYYLFCYAWDCLPQSRVVDVSGVARPDTLNLFAHVIKTGTEHILRRGLDRGYSLERAELLKLRGKIDFAGSISSVAASRISLVCEFDEFVPDVLHNQILRATIKRLARAEGIDVDLRAALNKLDPKLNGVSQIHLNAALFRRVQIHRNNSFYGFLMQVCELLYAAALPDRGKDGQYLFREILDDESYMATVFEKFMRRFYELEQEEFPFVGRPNLSWDATSAPIKDLDFLPNMRTDALLRSANRLIIVDAKYYKDALQSFREKRTIHSKSLYQLMAYLRSAQKQWPDRSCEGILLYPVAASKINLRYVIDGHPVRIYTLNLNKPWRKVCKALLALIRPIPLRRNEKALVPFGSLQSQ